MEQVRHFYRGILMLVLVSLVQMPLVMVAVLEDVPAHWISLFVILGLFVIWWYAAIGLNGRVTCSKFVICALIWLIPIIGLCVNLYWAGKGLTRDEHQVTA